MWRKWSVHHTWKIAAQNPLRLRHIRQNSVRLFTDTYKVTLDFIPTGTIYIAVHLASIVLTNCRIVPMLERRITRRIASLLNFWICPSAAGQADAIPAELGDISAGGAYFWAKQALEVTAPLRMILSLQIGRPQTKPFVVVCQGTVIRLDSPRADGRHGVAAGVERFHVLDPVAALPGNLQRLIVHQRQFFQYPVARHNGSALHLLATKSERSLGAWREPYNDLVIRLDCGPQNNLPSPLVGELEIHSLADLETLLLCALCQSPAGRARDEFVSSLQRHEWSDREQGLFFQMLTGLLGYYGNELRRALLANLTRAGFPDIDVDPYFAPLELRGDSPLTLAKELYGMMVVAKLSKAESHL
jgi:hypothetical protein